MPPSSTHASVPTIPTLVEKCAPACVASGKGGGFFLALDWCDSTSLLFALHRRLAATLDTPAVAVPSRPLPSPPSRLHPLLPPWVDPSASAAPPRELGTPDTTAQVHPGLFTRAVLAASAPRCSSPRSSILNMREPRIAAEIAKELQKFHLVDIPGSKEPQLWNDIFKFLKKASVLKFDDNEKQKRYETISFREIQDEVKDLKDLSDLLHAPVVYAHNDLLSGNLMLNDSEEKLYFVDFEYGSYSYRGYDIANHFNEYAGFDCDYDLYPDKDAQYHFFRNYLQADRANEACEFNRVILCGWKTNRSLSMGTANFT
ncbi:hypothetical protein ACP70R_006624 [Stipagrostis hirtigluma subsp. patula]